MFRYTTRGTLVVATLLAAGLLGGTAGALTVPFTEDFSTDAADWRGALATQEVIHHATGGVDGGGYIAHDPEFPIAASALLGSQGAIIFRANSNNPESSGGAFSGDWLEAGVGVIRAYVRHDSTESPASFFLRLTTHPGNTGAMAFSATSSVAASDDWTLIEFPINPDNSMPAGGSYETTLADLGHMQIGARLTGTVSDLNDTFTFHLDKVSIAVPEPTGLLLLVGAVLCGLPWRRVRGR